MEIYTYLKQDHEAVAQLFKKIISARSSSSRENLFEELKQELLLHSQIEHDIFYKALENHAEVKELIAHANKDHQEIEDYLKTLSRMPTESKLWLEKIGELKHAVTHHVEEEENEIFPKAKKILSAEQAQNMGEEMKKQKQAL